MSDLSVVVVGFHPDPLLLDTCFESVSRAARFAGLDVDLIVVDNGGLPRDLVTDHGGVVVESQGNIGFASAANRGVSAAIAPYCLVLNPDAELDEHSLHELIEAHRAGAGDLLVGWLESGETVQVDALFSWWLSTERLVRRGRERRRLLRAAASGRPVPVTKVSGGALFGPTPLLQELGPFDDSFFLYGEDVDLSLRARARELRLSAVPTARVRHRGAASHDQHGSLVEQARVDAALRLTSLHRGWMLAAFARIELWIVTSAGLVSARTTSGTRSTRMARFHELRRWGIKSAVPKFSPSFEATGTLQRLLVIAPLLQGGGAQRALEAVLESAPAHLTTKTVTMFEGCRNYERVRDLSDEFAMWDLDPGPLGIAKAVLRLRREARVADAVLSLTRGSNCVVGLTGLRDKPTVLAQHMLLSLEGSGPRHAIEDQAYRRAILRAVAVVVPSQLARAEFEARFPTSREKLHVVDNPFTPDSRPTVPPRERPVDVLRLLFIGRLERQKGLDRLIPMLRRVMDRPCELRIGGAGSQLDIVEEAARCDMGGLAVVPLGWQEDVTGLVDWCDALVLPSRAELFPYAVQEAWSRGRPVLGSDIVPFRALAEAGPLSPLPMTDEAWGEVLSRLGSSSVIADDAYLRGPASAPPTHTGDLYLRLLGIE